jgi:predicted ArsR family transcriptional regulator
MANRGRPEIFLSKKVIVEALEARKAPSRYLTLRLVEKGYFTIEPVKTGRRGRPSYSYALTGKARGLLAIARNWGKKTENLFRDASEDEVEVIA